MRESYAMYRLPHADQFTVIRQTSGEPLQLQSCAELAGVEGFVMAPFEISARNPILVLKPDVIEDVQLSEEEQVIGAMLSCDCDEEERLSYSRDFDIFHRRLVCGDFGKIVLARRHDMLCDSQISPERLFRRACNMYPRMFVALVSTPVSGTWLMATPEILLEGEGRHWHTMALAGTMKLEGQQLLFDIPAGSRNDNGSIEWSEKNRCEQRIVAKYIAECLGKYSDEMVENGPYKSRAGNIVHLRSDFSFVLRNGECIGNLINDLHPTPAVCGLPKAETYGFIVKNEHGDRNYYSGFAGPWLKSSRSHLYVSLRCMQIEDRRYRMYAGGGLLADSIEQQEWDETEAKLETMKGVFG
ncbi:chorismate-binding protein [Prevotella sp. PCHR]|uniref:Chorismate-binding protein n=1 Tax=Xylanibacter caecicola TaxID=2736294 RepID=A0ABX2B1M7_9BACT|nr:chorismate-binding protein [Xylanibacter caecicola]NPE25419.1 chorismate-binding protein [Xylanibacter caecicola]